MAQLYQYTQESGEETHAFMCGNTRKTDWP